MNQDESAGKEMRASQPAPTEASFPAPARAKNVFTLQRRVEFADTDAAGIAHFSSLLLYMEESEHALLRSLGLKVHMQRTDEGPVSWPRVSIHADFHSPAHLDDVLEVRAWLVALGNKSVTYDFQIVANNRQVATGRTIAVCCHITPGQPPVPIPIPLGIRKHLDALTQVDSAF